MAISTTTVDTNATANAALKKENLANLFNIAVTPDNYNAFLINKSIFFKNTDNNMAASNFDLYEVRQYDTWTNISFKYYQTIELWWLICKTNEVINPFVMPDPGTLLKIMKKNIVYSSLLPMLKNAK
jgi:hypothetical protein